MAHLSKKELDALNENDAVELEEIEDDPGLGEMSGEKPPNGPAAGSDEKGNNIYPDVS